MDVNFRSSGDSHVDGDFSSALTLKKGAKEIMLRCVDESEGGIRRDVCECFSFGSCLAIWLETRDVRICRSEVL